MSWVSYALGAGTIAGLITALVLAIRNSGLKGEIGDLEGKVAKAERARDDHNSKRAAAEQAAADLRKQLEAADHEIDRLEGERRKLIKLAAENGADPGDLWDVAVGVLPGSESDPGAGSD